MIWIALAAAGLTPQQQVDTMLKACGKHVELEAIYSCIADKSAEVDARLNVVFARERQLALQYDQENYGDSPAFLDNNQKWFSLGESATAEAQQAFKAWRKTQCDAETYDEFAEHAANAKSDWDECSMRLSLQRIDEVQTETANLLKSWHSKSGKAPN